MSSREERLTRNETLFRNVNERIVEATDEWDGTYDLICECADVDCMSVMRVHVEDYRRLRECSRRFAVLPGHEKLDIEEAVERHHNFLIVEKHVESR